MNEHDRRQAEQARRSRIEQTAWLYGVPHDLAEIMSGEVLRLAEEYVRREFPAALDRRKSGGYQGCRHYREMMVIALKYVTEARSADEQDRAAWRAFWAKRAAQNAAPTPAELERDRLEREVRRKQEAEAEMRAARDAFLEGNPSR
jgi:hypothetical protein